MNVGTGQHIRLIVTFILNVENPHSQNGKMPPSPNFPSSFDEVGSFFEIHESHLSDKSLELTSTSPRMEQYGSLSCR